MTDGRSPSVLKYSEGLVLLEVLELVRLVLKGELVTGEERLGSSRYGQMVMWPELVRLLWLCVEGRFVLMGAL